MSLFYLQKFFFLNNRFYCHWMLSFSNFESHWMCFKGRKNLIFPVSKVTHLTLSKSPRTLLSSSSSCLTRCSVSWRRATIVSDSVWLTPFCSTASIDSFWLVSRSTPDEALSRTITLLVKSSSISSSISEDSFFNLRKIMKRYKRHQKKQILQKNWICIILLQGAPILFIHFNCCHILWHYQSDWGNQ